MMDEAATLMTGGYSRSPALISTAATTWENVY